MDTPLTAPPRGFSAFRQPNGPGWGETTKGNRLNGACRYCRPGASARCETGRRPSRETNAFIAQLAVEAIDVGVLRRLSWLDEAELTPRHVDS